MKVLTTSITSSNVILPVAVSVVKSLDGSVVDVMGMATPSIIVFCRRFYNYCYPFFRTMISSKGLLGT